jgi:16S rRNA (guanine527-N7)-methyltransferase
MTFEDALRVCASSFCTLSDHQVDVLSRHYHLLARWNRRLNLTSVIDPEKAAWKHYGESLYLAAQLPAGILRVADIGSGGGFPGFPLAVFRPECSVTLVESDVRKAAFLHECRELTPNLMIVNSRADSVQNLFDVLVSRAVHLTELDRLLPRLAPVAFSLTSCGSSTWNVVSHLPWDAKSCVVSRGTAKL